MPKFAHVMVLMDEWLPEAREDLTVELEYVYSEFGVQAAESAYLKVVEGIDNLCHFPHLGKRFGNIVFHGNEVRSLSFRQSSLIYCTHGESLLVIAFWNNRRDDKELKALIQSRQ